MKEVDIYNQDFILNEYCLFFHRETRFQCRMKQQFSSVEITMALTMRRPVQKFDDKKLNLYLQHQYPNKTIPSNKAIMFDPFNEVVKLPYGQVDIVDDVLLPPLVLPASSCKECEYMWEGGESQPSLMPKTHLILKN